MNYILEKNYCFIMRSAVKMQFRTSLRFLRLWTFSKETSTNLISSRYINAAVTHGTFLQKPMRTIKEGSLGNFIKMLMTKNITRQEVEEDWGGPEAFKLITFIGDDFDDTLKKHSQTLVFFSAAWCPHCRRLRKPYGLAAAMSKEANLPMVFTVFDVSRNPQLADEKGVIGIPLIRYYKDEKFVTNYQGKRTAEDLFNFAKNPQSLPKLKQPDI